jgi:hypothetical protein
VVTSSSRCAETPQRSAAPRRALLEATVRGPKQALSAPVPDQVLERRRPSGPLGSLRTAEGGKSGVNMTPDERERMAILCERIATEKDHDRFTALVKQLDDLLRDKERRLKSEKKSK